MGFKPIWKPAIWHRRRTFHWASLCYDQNVSLLRFKLNWDMDQKLAKDNNFKVSIKSSPGHRWIRSRLYKVFCYQILRRIFTLQYNVWAFVFSAQICTQTTHLFFLLSPQNMTSIPETKFHSLTQSRYWWHCKRLQKYTQPMTKVHLENAFLEKRMILAPRNFYRGPKPSFACSIWNGKNPVRETGH